MTDARLSLPLSVSAPRKSFPSFGVAEGKSHPYGQKRTFQAWNGYGKYLGLKYDSPASATLCRVQIKIAIGRFSCLLTGGRDGDMYTIKTTGPLHVLYQSRRRFMCPPYTSREARNG